MDKTIFKKMERVAQKFPNNIAFTDSKREITYKEFLDESKEVATTLLKKGWRNKPIVIYLDKNINCLSSMMGVNSSGNFYAIVDTKMPIERASSIFNTLEPICVITDEKNGKKLSPMNLEIDLINIENIAKEIEEEKLEQVYKDIIDTDPMYVLFTSGSTGNPKGAILNHKAVTSYVQWFVERFEINEKTSFGSQTPFYFSMSVSDVFATMTTGATLHIIPKMLFSFPVKLIEFLNEKKINTIYWVPSALSIVANFKTFEYILPKYLEKVLFAGETMPMKQLNIWRESLPDLLYANLFGPTETTDICAYYVVDRKFNNDETLPIGSNCENCGLLVIKEDGNLANINEEGELCARGSFLSSGYYNNPQKTTEVFVQNPLNSAYPEIVYKTGDIVKINERNELIYLSRKDFQIKHMGYRIELGEIETAINSLPEIETSVCIYDMDKSKIVLFYKSSSLSELEVMEAARNKVPMYMCPNEIIKIDRIPYNANGKIDRKELKKKYKEGKGV